MWIRSGPVKRWICSSESICRVLKGQPLLSGEAIERSLSAVSKPALISLQACLSSEWSSQSRQPEQEVIHIFQRVNRGVSWHAMATLVFSYSSSFHWAVLVSAILTPSFPFFPKHQFDWVHLLKGVAWWTVSCFTFTSWAHCCILQM